MENPPIFKFGKPSISIRAIYTMAMLVITRGYIPLSSHYSPLLTIKSPFSYGNLVDQKHSHQLVDPTTAWWPMQARPVASRAALG